MNSKDKPLPKIAVTDKLSKLDPTLKSNRPQKTTARPLPPDQATTFYKTLFAARHLSELKRRTHRIIKQLGFSDFSFGALYSHHSSPRLNEVLSSTPPALAALYQQRQLYRYDILPEYIAANTEPVFQSTLKAYIERAPFTTERLHKNSALFQLWEDHQYFDAFILPRVSSNQPQKMALSIKARGMPAATFRQHIAHHKPVIYLLSEALEHIVVNQFADALATPVKNRCYHLTQKPLALLTLLATLDVSLGEAATRLGISIGTANKHMATAKRLLSVRTANAAIYRAVSYGLIKPDEGRA